MKTTHCIDLSAVNRLLLNAWSAEYALSIPPIANDDEYIKSMVAWTLPQAYYVGYFGVRAIFQASGIRIVTESALQYSVNILAQIGLYREDAMIFTELEMYRKPDESFRLPNEPATMLFLAELRQKARRIAAYHETYIRKLIGADNYRAMLSGLPDYLSFVSERERSLDEFHENLTPALS